MKQRQINLDSSIQNQCVHIAFKDDDHVVLPSGVWRLMEWV